jgi:hypothetical protein
MILVTSRAMAPNVENTAMVISMFRTEKENEVIIHYRQDSPMKRTMLVSDVNKVEGNNVIAIMNAARCCFY